MASNLSLLRAAAATAEWPEVRATAERWHERPRADNRNNNLGFRLVCAAPIPWSVSHSSGGRL